MHTPRLPTECASVATRYQHCGWGPQVKYYVVEISPDGSLGVSARMRAHAQSFCVPATWKHKKLKISFNS